MDLIEERTELPRITRLVHAAFLSGLEGVSLGFALATSLYSSRLVQFVKTNRIEAKLRKEMLSVVILPSLVVPLLILVSCLASARFAENRLNTIERRVRLLSPVCVLGFVPLLLQPSLWVDQTLAFLLVTGAFALVVTATVRVSCGTWIEGHEGQARSDFDHVMIVAKSRLSPKVVATLVASLLVVVAAVSAFQNYRETNLAGTALHAEWAALQGASTTNGVLAWIGEKGWRATGHFGLLGAVYSMAGSAFSTPHGLLLFRLTAVSLAALPLFLWSKRALGIAAACVIAAAYLSMPVSGMLALRDSFPISAALGIFFLAAYYLQAGKLTKGLAFVALGIALTEQLALWYSLLGIYLVQMGSRKAVGQILALASFVYFLVVALWLLPSVGIRTYSSEAATNTLISVQNLQATLTSLLINPAYALSRWFEMQTLEYWLALCVPLALLPLRGRNWLLWLGPVLLLAATPSSLEPNAQWRDPVFASFLALGFTAVIATLQGLRQSQAPVGALRLKSALIGWLAVLAPCISLYGALYYRH